MEYARLLSPGTIGTMRVKNRVVMPAMMMGLGRFDGCPTARMMDYYEERARGGAGLIVTEITRVDDFHGAGSFAQLGLSHDYQVAPLAELVRRVHAQDCRILVQLHHPGRQNFPLTVGTMPPSIFLERIFPGFRALFYKLAPAFQRLADKGLVLSVVAPSKTEPCRYVRGRNRALRHAEVRALVGKFIRAAERAKRAGADGVELHASHGYLIQQFLSPFTNRRTDEYGGSLENRMRFLLEIVRGVRAACGKDFPLVVRLSVDECYDRIGEPGKGYGLEEGLAMAKRLEEEGVDALNVSSATYETMNYWLEPTSFTPGWRLHLAAAVKKAVSIPVIAANFIRSPGQAESQLAAGDQDFVALGRPHLADPAWTQKVAEGREVEIRRCIACLWCFESMQRKAYEGEAGECAVNPEMGHEAEAAALRRDGAGRTAVVVGAGPAGLTAARVLADRGFRTIVLDKASRAGGQLLLAERIPLKEKMDWCRADLEAAARRSGVDIRFGTEATAALIASLAPQVVVLATGGTALRPSSIPGADRGNVCTSTDILDGTLAPKGKRVVVVGSGMTGLETAEVLAESGNTVTVVEMAERIAPLAHVQHVDDLMPRLRARGVAFLPATRLVEVTEKGLLLEGRKDQVRREFPADIVVLALGVRPENALRAELAGGGQTCVVVVGDADKPGRIGEATRSAWKVAMELA